MVYFFDFVLLVLIYFFWFFQKWKKNSRKTLKIKTVMYFYIVMVLFVTIMPFTIALNETNKWFMETANFIPFRDIRLGYAGAVREIILNIIMMIPFGFLYPIIKKKGVIKTVFTTLFFSLLIESTQLVSVWWGSVDTRIFDVTDLITNTLGGLIGFLLYKLLKLINLKIK